MLVKYGMTSEELSFNYSSIRSICREFKDTDVSYDVSVDITHSFRSIPYYNIAVINYIRYVTDTNIRLSHIYYGNLDVKNEIGYASVVDLEDVTGLFEKTNAVSEFQRCGNAGALIRLVGDDRIRNELADFDWAARALTLKPVVTEITVGR